MVIVMEATTGNCVAVAQMVVRHQHLLSLTLALMALLRVCFTLKESTLIVCSLSSPPPDNPTDYFYLALHAR